MTMLEFCFMTIFQDKKETIKILKKCDRKVGG